VTPAERNARLEALADEPDPARKRLLALGIVSDRLREAGLEPILVGGAAVEFYTAGGYATKDVDLALPHGPATDAAFADLDWTYLHAATANVPAEAKAVAALEREARQ
jgi:hypothetical protein